MVEDRVRRYKDQSVRHRASAFHEIREGRWERVEDLLWGSLVGALKAVALDRGDEIGTADEIRSYMVMLAGETADRRLGDGFQQLSAFAVVHQELPDSRRGPERMYRLAERVSYSIERLWDMLPPRELEASRPSSRRSSRRRSRR